MQQVSFTNHSMKIIIHYIYDIGAELSLQFYIKCTKVYFHHELTANSQFIQPFSRPTIIILCKKMAYWDMWIG